MPFGSLVLLPYLVLVACAGSGHLARRIKIRMQASIRRRSLQEHAGHVSAPTPSNPKP